MTRDGAAVALLIEPDDPPPALRGRCPSAPRSTGSTTRDLKT
jgi:hypothetical protein